jgi:cysteine sulfinate desulfinase/cysteine desulfurase-like protein
VDPLLLVRGGATTEGALRVNGAGGNVPHACTVRSATLKGREVQVSCEPMEIAISGGGRCEKGDLKASRPLQAGASPSGWEVSCGKSAQQTAHAICCAQ